MLFFVLRRLGAGAALLAVIASVTFVLINLAGQDPARQVAGQVATAAQVEAKRAELGLDQPLAQRYLEWLGHALQGDLGVSWFTNEPVAAILARQLPVTLSLVLGSILVTALISVVLGVTAAVRGGWVDRVLQLLSTLTFATPNFLIALVLAGLFAVKLGLFPATGYVALLVSPSAWLASVTLPVLALALGAIATIAVQVRGSMIDVLGLDYIRTLRARGLPTRSVLYRHALRNAAPPAVAMISVQFIAAISGAVIVEKVFNLPGIGSQASISATQGDLPLVIGIVLLTVTMVVLVNLLLDLAQGWLNPKVRLT